VGGSNTMQTARSCSSGEYLLGRGMGSILSRNGPSDKPSDKLLRIQSAGITVPASWMQCYGEVTRTNAVPPVVLPVKIRMV
jgi:hypothetical protein